MCCLLTPSKGTADNHSSPCTLGSKYHILNTHPKPQKSRIATSFSVGKHAMNRKRNCVYTYIYTHTHTHIYIYVFVYVYVYAGAYAFVLVFMRRKSPCLGCSHAAGQASSGGLLKSGGLLSLGCLETDSRRRRDWPLTAVVIRAITVVAIVVLIMAINK